MKKTIIITILLVVPCLTFPQVSLEGSIVSDYVWRGANVLDDAPALQPSLSCEFGETGLSVNLWGSFSITRRGESAIRELDELDFTASYERPIKKIDIAAGIIHYDWFQAEGWPDNATTTYEFFTGFAFTDLSFSPGITVYYDLNKDGGDGLYLLLGGGKTFELESARVDASFSIGYMDQNWKTDAGISDINLSFSTTLSHSHFNYSPSLTFTYVPDDNHYSHGLIIWSGIAFVIE